MIEALLQQEEEYPKERIALVIQYLGTNYHGWQYQTRYQTVQGEIEKAIASTLDYPVRIKGAGRTDAGVHAAAQVAHFDAITPIPAYRWSKVLNGVLPEDIVIRASAKVADDWHAQFSALWRRYRYTIYTDKRPNLFVKQISWHYYHSYLDESLIQTALYPLIGKNELSAFRRSGSSRSHSWVEIQAAECYRRGPFVHIEIQASGFLYGMVRLMVGMLVEVGAGRLSPADFTLLWFQKRRSDVKSSAPARGLCLLRVGYSDFPVAENVWFDSQPLFTFRSEETGSK